MKVKLTFFINILIISIFFLSIYYILWSFKVYAPGPEDIVGLHGTTSVDPEMPFPPDCPACGTGNAGRSSDNSSDGRRDSQVETEAPEFHWDPINHEYSSFTPSSEPASTNSSSNPHLNSSSTNSLYNPHLNSSFTSPAPSYSNTSHSTSTPTGPSHSQVTNNTASGLPNPERLILQLDSPLLNTPSHIPLTGHGGIFDEATIHQVATHIVGPYLIGTSISSTHPTTDIFGHEHTPISDVGSSYHQILNAGGRIILHYAAQETPIITLSFTIGGHQVHVGVPEITTTDDFILNEHITKQIQRIEEIRQMYIDRLSTNCENRGMIYPC